MLSIAADAPIAFLSGPHITSDSYIAGALTSGDALLGPLVYRTYQLDPSQLMASSGVPSIGSPVVITSGIYVGSALTMRAADTFFLLNTNAQNFKIETCPDFGTGNTWAVAVNYTSTPLAAADLVTPIASPVAYNGIRLTVTSTQDGNALFLAVFNSALLLYQASRGFQKFTPTMMQTSREVVLADKTTDTAYIYWSDGSFTLQDMDFSFDLMSAADKAGIEAVINAPDPFLVLVEPGYLPRELYLCKVKPGSYRPEYSMQFKGAGYKFPLGLKHMGWL
jgi:hypothetical protein